MEGVAVFLLGVDGLHTGFYHAGYSSCRYQLCGGLPWGGGGDHWERRERGKKKSKLGLTRRAW